MVNESNSNSGTVNALNTTTSNTMNTPNDILINIHDSDSISGSNKDAVDPLVLEETMVLLNSTGEYNKLLDAMRTKLDESGWIDELQRNLYTYIHHTMNES